MESQIQISDRQKVVITKIDHAAVIDIRLSFLQDVTGPKLDDEGCEVKDEKSGEIIYEIVPTWCRCSQALSIPIAKWPAFVEVINAIES